MRGRAVGAAASVLVGLAAIACEDIAHVSDYRIDQTVAFHGLCNACPAGPVDLKHPPCPLPDDTPDDGHVYVYVHRTMYLGLSHDPTLTSTPGAYDANIGYDMDCSDREPSGAPVLCAPSVPDAAPLVPWAPYARGIDNSLSQRIFSYLSVLGSQNLGSAFVPLDTGISQDWNAGKASILTVVYNWNGTDNDPKVSFRVISTLGTVGGVTPKWDGTDEWIGGVVGPDPNANDFEIPQVNFATDDAYVSGGTIVADLSFVDPANAYVVNNGASLEVSMHRMSMTGQITRDEIADWEVQAVWAVADFKNARSDIANWLSGCDATISQFLCGLLPELADQAADMPLDPSAAVTQPCDALSLSWGADAYRAHIGTYESVSAAAGCPIVCP